MNMFFFYSISADATGLSYFPFELRLIQQKHMMLSYSCLVLECVLYG